MAPPIKLQIVFQGGGAKLASLMAVCAALEKLRLDREIEISRVAGSSAGAIAAVMLASGVEIATYVERLRRIEKKYGQALEISKTQRYLNLLRGKALFPDLDLFAFFSELFPDLKKVEDLALEKGTPARIYHTNLVTLEGKEAGDGDSLAQALASSCRFPIAFGSYKSDDRLVDGGLAMNLPVDDFKREEAKFGNVVGISFNEDYTLAADADIFEYVKQLFSAAIQGGVARSILMLGRENVYSIPTSISTFDFRRAIDHGFLPEVFLGTSAHFKSWFADWVKQHAPIRPATPLNADRLIRPQPSTKPWKKAVVRELDQRWKNWKTTHAESIEMIDTALLDADGQFTGLYRSVMRKRFRIVSETHILQFSCQIGGAGNFVATNLGCNITDRRNNQLDFSVHLQEVTPEGASIRTFNVYFLFDEPLQPGSTDEPYYLEYQYEGDDPYDKLGTRSEIVTLEFKQGDSENVMIAVALPASKFGGRVPNNWDVPSCPREKYARKNWSEEEAARFAPMPVLVPVPELIPLMGLTFGSKSYEIIGRRAKNIKQYQRVGFVVE